MLNEREKRVIKKNIGIIFSLLNQGVSCTKGFLIVNGEVYGSSDTGEMKLVFSFDEEQELTGFGDDSREYGNKVFNNLKKSV